jgi:hypothetical protein
MGRKSIYPGRDIASLHHGGGPKNLLVDGGADPWQQVSLFETLPRGGSSFPSPVAFQTSRQQRGDATLLGGFASA